MHGVTLSTYKAYCRKKGRPEPTVEDLKNISDSDWGEIVVSGYWGKMQADKIDNQSVANIMVDWLFNSGAGKIKNIQRIVGVTADGIVGQKTLSAINQSNQKDLFDKIKAARIQFYYDIVKNKPDQKIFLKGWLNRVNDYKYSQQ